MKDWEDFGEDFWAEKPTKQEILDKLEEKECEEILIGAPLELLSDREFILKAVDICGWALQYASDELKNDEEIVLTAIQGHDICCYSYSRAIEHASEELRSNKEFMRKAIEVTNGEAFVGATDELKNDKEMVLFAVNHWNSPDIDLHYVALYHASEEMKADKDVVLAAVRQNGWSLEYASDELKADKDVVLVATINSTWSLKYASPALRSDKEFVIELVKIVGKNALEYIDETLQNDADVLEAAKRHVPFNEDCGFEYYGLNKIIIPATSTCFDARHFLSYTFDRNELEGITVEEGHPLYHSEGNCLIETESKKLLLGCKNSVIPDDGSVELIAAGAFAHCEGLTSMHIPASITGICGEYYSPGAFEFCSNLERVTVSPDNKHIYSINDEILVSNSLVAFVSKNVKSFHFSADITDFLHGAFSCGDLETLTVDPDHPQFYSMNNCVLDKEYNTIYLGCKNSVIPDDRPIDIAPGAFMGVELKHLYLPANVESVDFSDGNGCIGIESITVADDHPRYHSMNNCLMEGTYLLRGSNNSVIPDDGSVTGFQDRAFADCTGLISITIPSTISAIEADTFKNCINLTTVVLGNNIGLIVRGAFDNCNKLAHVFYRGTQDERKNNLFVDSWNGSIAFETWYYYSEEAPTEDGDYWHYVDGEPTIW